MTLQLDSIFNKSNFCSFNLPLIISIVFLFVYHFFPAFDEIQTNIASTPVYVLYDALYTFLFTD